MNKKIITYCFIFVLMFVSFFPLKVVDAKTLKDYRNDLAALKKEKAEAEANSEKIQAQIDAANEKIRQATVEIADATKEQKDTEDEIEILGKKIDEKEKQIKDLVSFLQLSNGENFYLKYIFGAESFTDLIYRFAVVEQLTKRNDELVEEMNELIVSNEKKIKELEKHKKELAELNKKVQAEIGKLGSKKSVYIEETEDYDLQIKSMEKKIKYYVEQGCSETEDLNRCVTSVPYDYGFSKPLKTGVVTDEFGMRYHPIYHYWKLHTGIDLGGNREGTPVYAPASGKVVNTTWHYYCGGNMVYINHTINGVDYTTQYMHLLDIYVKSGDIVEKGQQIGTVGGGAKTASYETCSTGAHLHFMVAKGHYYGTGASSYSSYSTYVSKLINPRDVLYFPAYGSWW